MVESIPDEPTRSTARSRRPVPGDASPTPDRVEVELERTYASEREAEELRCALEADRPSYLRTERTGATLRFGVSAPSAASVRSTLDDLLAALAAAERVRGIGSRSSAPNENRSG
ncbi:MAG: hypothetical protein L3K13_00875 [Thermoplasmata archaeon]|nr:hypothetical protein [Thermoplasmata archaeon]